VEESSARKIKHGVGRWLHVVSIAKRRPTRERWAFFKGGTALPVRKWILRVSRDRVWMNTQARDLQPLKLIQILTRGLATEGVVRL
jgi:hypothetical protein